MTNVIRAHLPPNMLTPSTMVVPKPEPWPENTPESLNTVDIGLIKVRRICNVTGPGKTSQCSNKTDGQKASPRAPWHCEVPSMHSGCQIDPGEKDMRSASAHDQKASLRAPWHHEAQINPGEKDTQCDQLCSCVILAAKNS